MTALRAWFGMAAFSAVAVAGFWVLNQTKRGGWSGYTGTEAPTDPQPIVEGASAELAIPTEIRIREYRESSRQPVGRVASLDGEPLGGAYIRVVGVRRRANTSAWLEIRDDSASRVAFEVESVSDDTGAYTLPEFSLLPDHDYFLYVSAAGHQVLSESISSLDWTSGNQTLVLKPCDSVSLVVLRNGVPVAGAEVLQEGMFCLESATDSLDFEKLDLQRLYRHRVVTNQSGRATLPFHMEPTSAWAFHGGSVTPRLVGILSGTSELHFGSSALITGHVPGYSQDPSGLAGTVTVRDAHSEAILGVALLREDGEFGPLSIALDGIRNVFVEATLGQSRGGAQLHKISPGARLHVSLPLHKGHDLWVQLIGTDGKPITNGVLWVSMRDWAGRARRVFHARNDGYIHCEGIQAGVVSLCAFAEGYAMTHQNLLVPESEPLTHQLVLDRGGQIEGKVTMAHEPVKEFRIHVLDRTGRPLLLPEQFWNAEGRFTLKHVKAGELQLFAESKLGASPVVRLVVDSGKTATANPEILRLVEVRGAVVDQKANPIPTATVRLVVGGAQVGLASNTAVDGTFLLPASAGLEQLRIEVRAEGYKSRQIALSEFRDGQNVDLMIKLEPRTKLQVQLVGANEKEYSRHEIWIQGEEERVHRFSREGIATIWVDSPGDLTLVLAGVGLGFRRIPVKLSRWPKAPLRVDLGGGCGIDFELLEFDPQQIAQGVFVIARGQDMANGGLESDSSYCWLQGEFTCRLGGLARDRYWVRVLSPSGETLAGKWVDCGDQNTPVIITPAKSFVEVTVQGDEGGPEVACFVAVQFGEAASWDEGLTDERGAASFVVPGPCQGMIFVRTERGCVTWQVPAVFSGLEGIQPLSVSSSCDGGIRVRLLDSEGPIVGANCQLLGMGFPKVVAGPLLSDADGIVEFSNVNPGQYRVKSLVPNHWPYIRNHEASIDPQIQDVWIPRLADLRVEVRNAAGRPIAGKEVRVWTLDFDKDTRAWHDAGAMEVIPSDWRTDQYGVLTIPRFAEGNYVCSAVNEQGELVEVKAQVRPGQENMVVIELD